MDAELVEMARGRATKMRSVLHVGVVAALPKTVFLPSARTSPGGQPWRREGAIVSMVAAL